MRARADVLLAELSAFNARDTGGIIASFSPDCDKRVPGARLVGGEQIAAWCAAMWEAFPDCEVKVTGVVEEGPRVSVQGRVSGTHLGPLRTPAGEFSATGRRADVTFAETAGVRGGVMVAVHLEFDRLETLE